MLNKWILIFVWRRHLAVMFEGRTCQIFPKEAICHRAAVKVEINIDIGNQHKMKTLLIFKTAVEMYAFLKE